MAVISAGKRAITHFRCKKRYQGFTLLHVQLETGRTHQIRVHLSHEGYPIVGDAVYGWRYRLPAHSSSQLRQILASFKRQALHAWKLSFPHPITHQALSWEAPLPQDFLELINLLKE